MRRLLTLSITLVLLGTVMLQASCNLPTNQTATPDAKSIITEAAVTVAAQLTLAAQLTPSLTFTHPAPLANTSIPPVPTVGVSTPMPVPTETAKPTSGTSSSADSASFVADVTVPDGTAAIPGSVFEKTWRIKNTGTTTWSPAYTLVWVEGDKMGSPEGIPIPKDVRPGETVDISVMLTAPAKAGTYQTFFRLRNANGQYFKLDGTGDLWVKIIVGLAATNTPNSETLTATVAISTSTPD